METEIVACIVTEASTSLSESQTQEAAPMSSPDHLGARGEQLLRRRKQLNPFLAPTNPYQLTNSYARRVVKSTFPQKVDAITQRVLSGKEHRIKQLESDLGMAQNKLCELAVENRLLRSLNKRNNAVLSRFQDVEAELPNLLSFHDSEVRSLRERFQKLSVEHREQARELRGKNLALQSTREQLASLTKLVEEKGLKERQELTAKLEETRETVTELEAQHKTLQRQLMLEKKSHKNQLIREQKRYKELKTELQNANDKIFNLEAKLKSKEKFITDHLTRKEFHQAGRSLSSFKTLSLNSDQKMKRVVFPKRRQMSSTAGTPPIFSTSGQQDDDDAESDISYSQNIAPSIDSLINHLNYSSSDTDEEVSQIYRARPTSVPQLSLNTSASTPWAVDSRTFSVRTTEPVIAPQLNQPPIASQITNSNTPTPSPPPPNSEPQDSEGVVGKTSPELSGQDDNIKTCVSDFPSKEEAESQEAVTPASSVNFATRTTTPVKNEESSEDMPNYSKEALLAALKAIDVQHTTESSEQNFPINSEKKSSINLNNHVRKVELMQELFGSEEAENRGLDGSIELENPISENSRGNVTQT